LIYTCGYAQHVGRKPNVQAILEVSDAQLIPQPPFYPAGFAVEIALDGTSTVITMQSLPSQIRQCARLNGSFTLRSGKVSDTYFDKYQFEADPKLLQSIAKAMASLVRIWTPPQRQETDRYLAVGDAPAVVYPASEVDSVVVRADMESASPMRQSLRTAGKLPEELSASVGVG
jgi:hypothetical protein